MHTNNGDKQTLKLCAVFVALSSGDLNILHSPLLLITTDPDGVWRHSPATSEWRWLVPSMRSRRDTHCTTHPLGTLHCSTGKHRKTLVGKYFTNLKTILNFIEKSKQTLYYLALLDLADVRWTLCIRQTNVKWGENVEWTTLVYVRWLALIFMGENCRTDSKACVGHVRISYELPPLMSSHLKWY